ncbi:MAG TPA: FAD:protein FMN transferase [Acidobacteriota bacterium]|nr:FAD:protein FMN transferase [Acidobacteriota bacterium]
MFFHPDPVSVAFETMGTKAALTLGGRESDQLTAASARVKELMQSLNQELSDYLPDSVVSHLNAFAGIQPIEVPEHTRRLLELSQHYSDLTGGAFDVTVGPVVRLWRSARANRLSIPSEQTIKECLALVDYRRVEIKGRSAFLTKRGMRVDFGAIGKGYAVDRAWEECRALGITSFMFDLGGNIRVSGEAKPGMPWSIGIRDPFETESNLGKIEIPDGWAVATSGQYERFVEIEGRRYGHIIDPRTGFPASGLAGVTVLAPDATTTDALSTGLFILGPAESIPVIRKAQVEAVFIPDKQPTELWVTPGIQPRLTLFRDAKVRILPGW